MNRAATLTLNAPLLMLVAALALSTPFFAGAAPAFLDYAQQQTQAHEKSDAATAKQTSGDRQNADNKKKTPNTAQLQKRIVSQQATIEQKNKTIQQLKKQLANTPATETSIANEQAALNNKIKELQIALTAATAKNEALIKKEGAVQNTTLQQSQAAALKQIQQLTSQLQQAAAENKRLSASLTALNTDKQTLANRLAAAEKAQQTTLDQVKTLNADKQPLVNRLAATEKEKQTALDQVKTLNADKQSLANRLAAAEKEKQTALDQIKALNADKQPLVNRLAAAEKEKQTALDQIKALNADKQSLANRLAAAEKAPSSRADAAVAAKDEPPEMAAIVAAYRLQADKDNAQLRMKEDEIQLLRTQLTVPPRNTTGKTAAKLSAPGEQQAYAIGASMGTEALNVLTTRRTQGVNVDAGLVLQGIEDAFSGQLRLGEQERNKALFDISQQVFQNLNKIEQKNISAGKKYQQAFARKKDVVFKEGVYSRIDYPGKGKISGNDLVTVVIKEMLTDGTVINDMEAKDQALTQKLDAYPPVFRGPLKRLQNHGSVTLVVPPDKAYGSKGLPPKIPPGATMVYSVRIVDSQPAPTK
ncbi:peptidyl-prolyl cis-trans isomerase, FKBP-type domain [Klebsiella quasipneumoniae]|nr:peptidylprolyl isomerase [Klebsiella quasipneumoniae]SSD86325.1 peptidyl-prolyl cis-trans isomerase, FKBP-type domain [Klebsiella quasipneumoniae]SXD30159.1 peptidyl-prolyl cis-trans isomerase, FKBP-type domain [Klebsiella quasipneumoniae]VGL29877.1 peptidyl-prolyl cis-trans isomerase, FKBP-type domain [Klebsiella quasipneumoniae]VGP47083.1 FKBP-type peptidyl-prolyl cis-trans isomerase FkpA [Klebsiella quasipneumoniae subsp. similipneumoniae]